jgi:hypothetical protein
MFFIRSLKILKKHNLKDCFSQLISIRDFITRFFQDLNVRSLHEIFA